VSFRIEDLQNGACDERGLCDVTCAAEQLHDVIFVKDHCDVTCAEVSHDDTGSGVAATNETACNR